VLGGCLNFLKQKPRLVVLQMFQNQRTRHWFQFFETNQKKKHRIKEETATGSSYFQNLKELTDGFHESTIKEPTVF
jgi:hypothetical protein